MTRFSLMIVGVLDLLLEPHTRVIDFFMPIYIFFFGVMTLAIDFDLKLIIEYCGFLSNFFGRGLFNVYCGLNLIMTYQLSSTDLVEQ